jgi:hypothetical protein
MRLSKHALVPLRNEASRLTRAHVSIPTQQIQHAPRLAPYLPSGLHDRNRHMRAACSSAQRDATSSFSCTSGASFPHLPPCAIAGAVALAQACVRAMCERRAAGAGLSCETARVRRERARGVHATRAVRRARVLDARSPTGRWGDTCAGCSS